MKAKQALKAGQPKRRHTIVKPSQKTQQSASALDIRASRTIELFVRVLMSMGFDRSFIAAEIRKVTQSLHVRPLKHLNCDVRGLGRVMSRWANDPEFVSGQGKPLDLEERGAVRSFERIMKLELPDCDVASSVEFLIASRCAMRTKRGLLRWRSSIAQRISGDAIDVEDSLRPLQALLETIAQNMVDSAAGKNISILECGISGFQVGDSDFSDLCHHTAKHGILLLEQLDEWLATRQQRYRTQQVQGSGVRPYVGLFISRDGGA